MTNLLLQERLLQARHLYLNARLKHASGWAQPGWGQVYASIGSTSNLEIKDFLHTNETHMFDGLDSLSDKIMIDYRTRYYCQLDSAILCGRDGANFMNPAHQCDKTYGAPLARALGLPIQQFRDYQSPPSTCNGPGQDMVMENVSVDSRVTLLG